jgi:hypothetical protein
MMRRVSVLVAVLAGVSVASAQMPPSIKKPIEQAKKNVAATNAQTAAASPGAQAATPAAKPTAPVAKAPAKPPAAQPAPAAKDSNKVTFEREVFAYVSEGRRDPFSSPIETGEIRPLVADLKLVGVIYDPAGRNSVAVMRDITTSQQYRAKPGQKLGRARVSQIRPQEVVLTIEEYGFSRQEVLKLNAQQQTQQTKGKP